MYNIGRLRDFLLPAIYPCSGFWIAALVICRAVRAYTRELTHARKQARALSGSFFSMRVSKYWDAHAKTRIHMVYKFRPPFVIYKEMGK